MDGFHFDDLIRTLSQSRRSLLGGALALAGGWQSVASAKARRTPKRHKHKKRGNEPKLNAYGCLNVGVRCKNAGQCCSGVCEGKKGRRTCRAHDTRECKQDGPGFCAASNIIDAFCGETACLCYRTTGGSRVCGEELSGVVSQCADCHKDRDCEDLGFPPGSACAPLFGGRCDGACEAGMACIVPCGHVPQDP